MGVNISLDDFFPSKTYEKKCFKMAYMIDKNEKDHDEKTIIRNSTLLCIQSGFLNLLDGVVDTLGCILVMTTNHPELLDPSLVGRIDQKMMFGYMDHDTFMLMIEHYFQINLRIDQIERVKEPLHDEIFRLTPAECEQIVSEYDDIEDMVDALFDESHQRTLVTVRP